MAQEEMPEYKPTQTIQDVGGAAGISDAARYAATNDNGLSNIGAAVAQSAHLKMAELTGTEAGKEPGGWWSEARATFDKDFAHAYHTQADATLTLQANKLLLDSNVALARNVKLSEATIKSAHDQTALGLQNIVSHAPLALKGNLETTFASKLQNQTADYQVKMFNQQKQDWKDHLTALANENTHTAYNFGFNGNDKGIEALRETSRSAYSSPLMNENERRVANESLEKSYTIGKYSGQAQRAYQEKRLPEYLSKLAESNEIPPDQRQEVFGHVMSNISQIQNMEAQQQTITLTKFDERLAISPQLITGQDMLTLQGQVDPVSYEKANLDYINAMQKHRSSAPDYAGFKNAAIAGTMEAKQLNNTYHGMVSALVTEGVPEDKAQLDVMAQAGAPVPDFTDSLNARMQNGTPDQMMSAARQYDELVARGKGFVAPLDDKSKNMKANYLYNLRTMAPEDAAASTKELFGKQTAEETAAVKTAWVDQKSAITKGFNSDAEAGLALSGLQQYDGPFWNRWKPRDGLLFGQQMIDRLGDYFVAQSGNLEVAKQQLQSDVSNSFGHTQVNNIKEVAYFPIEKAVGLPVDDVSKQLLKYDIHTQIKGQLTHGKELYDKGESNQYWDMVPVMHPKDIAALESRKETKGKFESYGLVGKLAGDAILGTGKGVPKDEQLTLRRVYRSGKVEEYPVIIHASNYTMKTNDPLHPITGGWDVSVQTPMGLKPLIQLDPLDQMVNVNFDKKKLQKEYLELSGSFASYVTKQNNVVIPGVNKK